jgi:membrane glycosyltransferase
MKISDEKLKNLSKALYDIGKLSFAALVLGSVMAQDKFSFLLFLSGLIFSIICFAIAFSIDR